MNMTYGMVGGGPGALIGKVHRDAISLNGDCRLVAGVFSHDEETSRRVGDSLGLDPRRSYATYRDMAEREAERQDGIDFVSIVTPNYLHYEVAKVFLEEGINVACEKPLTTTLSQAVELKRVAKQNDCLFMVTYVYTGHVMAAEGREIVRSGEIGEVRIVVAEYASDWLADPIEKAEHKQASWRTDPEKSGISNCVADIGSHIENMVSFMTGLGIQKLAANLDVFGADRKLDDNAEVIVRYDNGASGTYWCSQVAIGYSNGLRVRVFGTKGTVEFDQENCNYLKVTKKNLPTKTYSRGSSYMSSRARSLSRIPAGHPEGYHEAFANLYSAFTDALCRKRHGDTIDESREEYPTIDAGIAGVRFVAKCVESSKNGGMWVDWLSPGETT